jgi:hypothetical protein
VEWVLLAAIVLVTAAFVAHAARSPGAELAEPETASEAIEARHLLLAELEEVDAELAAGRLTAEERRERRRALAPRLRAVTEELREGGWLVRSEAGPAVDAAALDTGASDDPATARDSGA